MEEISQIIKSSHKQRQCPCCGAFFVPGSNPEPTGTSSFPFCSRRCKLIDLNAWLEADYRIAAESLSETADDPA
jgi:endogenous inhibitor of DNA gyrase (YacG/DUF329 family)